MSEKIILGIDPGTTIMGFGIIKVKDRKMNLIDKSLQTGGLHALLNYLYLGGGGGGGEGGWCWGGGGRWW